MLTLRQLQYFVALAELRHFGRAAERCCVTQPALSMQIKELEDTLGVQLVERKRGHLELTADGREIAGRALGLINSARDLQDYVRHRRQTLVGELRLGVIPSVAPYLLPKVLPSVQARYPDLLLKLHETLTQSLVAEVADGALEAIILALPVVDARVESMPLFEDAFLLARRRTARRRRRQTVDIESLKRERILLLNDGHCLRDQVLSFCRSIDPGALAEFGASNLSTIMKMVATGYGVTLLPEIAAETELADLRIELRRFSPPEPKRTIGLAWRKTSTRKQDFVALGRLIVDAVRSDPMHGAGDLPPIDCVAP
jgi:LysR family transcriptional regulator, hydrogen peroxide-inducible genes activator